MGDRIMSRYARSSIALFVLALVSSAFASATEPHALAGIWAVDVSRIDQPNPPKSVTMTLAEADAGAYRMSMDIEAPDGKVMHAEGVFKPDGNAVRVQGSMDVDVVTMSMPNSRTLVMGGGFQGHPSSSRVWTLADDGKEMVEIAIRHLPDGTPYMRKFSWKRK
jgi:hypothetical protein